jgi:hypothetical protein
MVVKWLFYWMLERVKRKHPKESNPTMYAMGLPAITILLNILCILRLTNVIQTPEKSDVWYQFLIVFPVYLIVGLLLEKKVKLNEPYLVTNKMKIASVLYVIVSVLFVVFTVYIVE